MKLTVLPMLTLNGSAKPAIVLPSPGVISQVVSGVPGSSFSHTTGLAQSLGFASACANELPEPEGDGDGDGETEGDGDGEAEGDGDGEAEDDGEGEAEDEGEGEAESAGSAEAAPCTVTEEAAGAIAVMTLTTVTAIASEIAVVPAMSRKRRLRAKTRT